MGSSRSRDGHLGNIVIKLPLPPGRLPNLWNADARFGASYLADFPGYYKTADAGYRDADGYLFVMGRTDDVINVAGHRLSTGAMEEVLASHKDVAECAVIGAADALKGEVPIGFLVLKAGAGREGAAIEKEVVDLVRDRIGPVAAFKIAVTVARLPKTRSGEDPAGHHEEDCRRRELQHAGDHRRSGHTRRDRRSASGSQGRRADIVTGSASRPVLGKSREGVRKRFDEKVSMVPLEAERRADLEDIAMGTGDAD